MTLPVNPQFMENEIGQFTEMVWTSFLGLKPERLDTEDADSDGIPVRCAVQISGSWNGWFVMDLSTRLAERAAQSFYGDGEPTHEQIEDTMKELANLVGGNLKGLMPHPASLMFPIVSLEASIYQFFFELLLQIVVEFENNT